MMRAKRSTRGADGLLAVSFAGPSSASARWLKPASQASGSAATARAIVARLRSCTKLANRNSSAVNAGSAETAAAGRTTTAARSSHCHGRKSRASRVCTAGHRRRVNATTTACTSTNASSRFSIGVRPGACSAGNAAAALRRSSAARWPARPGPGRATRMRSGESKPSQAGQSGHCFCATGRVSLIRSLSRVFAGVKSNSEARFRLAGDRTQGCRAHR